MNIISAIFFAIMIGIILTGILVINEEYRIYRFHKKNRIESEKIINSLPFYDSIRKNNVYDKSVHKSISKTRKEPTYHKPIY